MEKISGAQADPTLLACFYGQGKTYKTSTLLACPPEMRPMAVLDTDKGAFIRLKVLTAEGELKKNLSEKVPEWAGPWIGKDVDFYYPSPEHYYADCWEFVTKIAKDYKTIAVDSLSRMADKLLKEAASTQYEGTGKQTKRVSLKSGTMSTTHPILSDYGFAQDRVMELIVAADDSPAHVVLVSHEKTGEIKDTDSTQRIIAGPRTIGNALLEVVPSVVDVALRFETRSMVDMKSGKRETGVVVRTRNHNFYLAGDRSGLFEDGMKLDPQVIWSKFMAMVSMVKEEGDVA